VVLVVRELRKLDTWNHYEGAGEVDAREDEMEEMGDDDSLSEMSDIISQSGDDQLYSEGN